MAPVRVLALVCALAACSKPAHDGTSSGSGSGVALSTGSGSGSGSASPPAPIDEPSLGMPSVDAYAYRTGAGKTAFRDARTAEAKADWPAVIAACRAAIEKDAGHLDAHWLLAAALAKTGALAEVREHLELAVRGDFARWGDRSLDHPMLAAFIASDAGTAWRAYVARLRERYITLLRTAQVVSAGKELYAVELGAEPRWHKLTNTSRRVIAGLWSPDRTSIVYVARAGTKKQPKVPALAMIDLSRAQFATSLSRLTATSTVSITVSVDPKTKALGANADLGKGAWTFADAEGLLSRGGAIMGITRATGPFATNDPFHLSAVRPVLDITKTTGRIRRIPIKNVTADWDDKGIASQIRLAPSNRIVSVPSPGLIDGNTLTWSPDNTQIAFVANLDETCAPKSISSAAYVANTSTGVVTELVRASRGIAIEWIGDRRLAIAADDGVALYSLDGAPPQPIAGAQKLVTPKKRPRCTEGADEPDDAPDEPDDPED